MTKPRIKPRDKVSPVKMRGARLSRRQRGRKMLSADYCRRLAAECLRLAQLMRADGSKQRMAAAAARWEQLAREAEKSVPPDHNEGSD